MITFIIEYRDGHTTRVQSDWIGAYSDFYEQMVTEFLNFTVPYDSGEIDTEAEELTFRIREANIETVRAACHVTGIMHQEDVPDEVAMLCEIYQ